MTSLDVNVFAPNGLIHLTPYTDHSVRRLLQHMPRAPIAYQGKVYQKPILNLAFVGLLPPGDYSKTRESSDFGYHAVILYE